MNAINTNANPAPRKPVKQLPIADKTNLILHVWGEMALESKFAGMSLAEFRTATAPTLDIREQLLIANATRKGAIATRNAADKATSALLLAVVSGVKADPAYGINSPLYRAMGFIPANERKPANANSSGTVNVAANEAAQGTTPIPTTKAPARRNLIARASRFVDAWTQFAPESSFAGLTLDGFTAAVAPSRTQRESLAKDRTNIAGMVAAKASADKATRLVIKRVVSSIKADRDRGPDSALYRALGYVTDSEVRPKKRTAVAAVSQTAAPVSIPSTKTGNPTA